MTTNTDPINLSGRSISGGYSTVNANSGLALGHYDATAKLNLDDSTLAKLAARLKTMFEPPDVLVKCVHCGQWAAAMTACHFCGAPVDPVERRRAEPVTIAEIAAGAIDAKALASAVWDAPARTTARNARITYTGPDGREIDITSDVTVTKPGQRAIEFETKWE